MGLNHLNLTDFHGGRTSSELSPCSCLQRGQATTQFRSLRRGGASPRLLATSTTMSKTQARNSQDGLI